MLDPTPSCRAPSSAAVLSFLVAVSGLEGVVSMVGVGVSPCTFAIASPCPVSLPSPCPCAPSPCPCATSSVFISMSGFARASVDTGITSRSTLSISSA